MAGGQEKKREEGGDREMKRGAEGRDREREHYLAISNG